MKMEIFVERPTNHEHDTRASADLVTKNDRSELPGGVLSRLDDSRQVLGTTLRVNPLGSDSIAFVDAVHNCESGSHFVSWSGTLAEELFATHPLTWLRPGHEAFSALCAKLFPILEERQQTLSFQPHARHVLSDVQSSVNFLNAHDSQPFRLAFSPGTLLEPSMLANIEDHLIRSFEELGPRCSMLMLHDVQLQSTLLTAVPLGEGLLPRDLILRLLERHVPRQTPIVLVDEKVERQRDWLSLG